MSVRRPRRTDTLGGFLGGVVVGLVALGLYAFVVSVGLELDWADVFGAAVLGPLALLWDVVTGELGFAPIEWYVIALSWSFNSALIAAISTQRSTALVVVSGVWIGLLTVGAIVGSLAYFAAGASGDATFALSILTVTLNVFAIPLGFVYEIPEIVWGTLLAAMLIGGTAMGSYAR